jgi:hypothetical protein
MYPKDTKWVSGTIGMTSKDLQRVSVNSASGDAERVAAISGRGGSGRGRGGSIRLSVTDCGSSTIR